MKTKLLLVFLITSIFSFAQQSIPSYYGADGAKYAVLSSTTPINQGASGAAVTWNFNPLTEIGNSTDSNLTPTANETTSYPNTTAVTKNVATVGSIITTSLIYSKKVGNVVSITAAKGANLDLNFNTDNATIGTFPMNYNYSNTDALAGTYNYPPYTGTFTGSVTTTVDAYGTLNLNITGSGLVSYPVTRLKSVQNIILNNGVLTNVGTIVQTTYGYYNSSVGNAPVFRTNTYTINVPLLSINETSMQMEKFVSFLGVNENQFAADTIGIYPNPVGDVLNIQNKLSKKINTITIIDLSGRTILKTNYNEKEINVSSLQKGIYIASIETESGNFTQKFIKK